MLNASRSVVRGCVKGTQAHPVEKKCLERSNGLKKYSHHAHWRAYSLENSWLRPWTRSTLFILTPPDQRCMAGNGLFGDIPVNGSGEWIYLVSFGYGELPISVFRWESIEYCYRNHQPRSIFRLFQSFKILIILNRIINRFNDSIDGIQDVDESLKILKFLVWSHCWIIHNLVAFMILQIDPVLNFKNFSMQ